MSQKSMFIFLFGVLSFTFSQPQQCFYGGPRPFYNIGHMANSIRAADSFIKDGANALEADVSLKDGSLITFHGFPCDCWRYCFEREDFEVYLNHIKRYTEYSDPSFGKLALLMLDMKMSSLTTEERTEIVAQFLAKILFENFYSKPHRQAPLKIVISIEKIEHGDFVLRFDNLMKRYPKTYGVMRPHIGWDISQSDDVKTNTKLWSSLRVSGNIWQGVGLTNCLPIAGWIRAQFISSALEARNDDDAPVKKIYRWTIDDEDFLKSTLNDQVDAIITNVPEKLRKIMRTKPYYGIFHLARLDRDDPWEKIVGPPSMTPIEIPVINKAIKALGNLVSTQQEVQSIPSQVPDC